MKKKPIKYVIYAAFALYILWILRITVFRPGCFSNGWFSGATNETPFREYAVWLRQKQYRLIVYLFFGNIGVFLPLGGFVRWKLPRLRVLGPLLIGGGFSACIEAGQYLLGSGVTDPADLILNTAGAVIGGLLMALVLFLRGKWRARDNGMG